MNQQHMQSTQNAAKPYMNAGQQSQPHMAPDAVTGGFGGGGNGDIQNDLLLQQLQQIHQYVQGQPDLLSGGTSQNVPGGAGGLGSNPEGGQQQMQQTTPQNILAALADIQKQQPGSSSNFGVQDGGAPENFSSVAKQSQPEDGGASGQLGQSGSHGQQQMGPPQQMTQQQLVDQKNNPILNLDLNSQSAAQLNPMLYQGLLQSQLQGLGGFNSSSSLGQLPNNNSQLNNSAGGFDLLNLPQMQMGGLYQNSLPSMMPFIPPLYPQSSSSGMGGSGHMGGQNGGGGGGHGSAASFHQPAEKNQVKLFVGGLAFSTSEQNLQTYFQKFGKVENTIVMRDRLTQRGRGFGFVLLSFNDEDQAMQAKRRIISTNKSEGHYIMDKRVDVKPADDHQGRGEGGGHGGGGGGGQGGNNQHHQGGGHQPNNFMMGNNGQQIQKPNPYCQVVQKDDVSGSDSQDAVKFAYPKSKIFVGGLDFKLTSEELKDHFMKFGDVQDAIILKDIYTGSSRGFGFVTFTSESVAQDLIKNNPVTEINGRRVDIKKAEPKDKNSNTPGGGGRPFLPRSDSGGRGGFHGNKPMGGMGGHHMGGGGGGNQPAVIPPYGQQPQGGREGENNNHRGGAHHGGHRGGMGGHHNGRGGYGRDSSENNGRPFDGGNGGNYHGGGGPGGGGDFRRQGSGFRQFDERERGGYRNGGAGGGYDRNDGHRGQHRGGGQDRRQGGYQGGQNHHNNNRQIDRAHSIQNNARTGGSDSSHESGQDSSYQISFQRAHNDLRKRHEQDGQQAGNRSGHHGGNSGNSGHRGRNDYGAGQARGGGSSGNHGGAGDKGYYQQQPSNNNNNNGGSQAPGGDTSAGNNNNYQGGSGNNRLNKQQGSDPQRRRFRSRSRD